MKSSILLSLTTLLATVQSCVVMHSFISTQFPLGTNIALQVWDNDVEVCHGNPAGNDMTAGGGDVRRLDCGNGAWVEITGQGAQWKYHSGTDGYEFAPAPGSGEKVGPKCTRTGGDPGEVNLSKNCATWQRVDDGLGCDAFPHHDNCDTSYCG